MKKISLLLAAFIFVMTAISCQSKKEDHPLQVKLQEYIDSCPAQIGVAVILPDQDTLVVNDGHYPMQSVVKLYQDLPSALTLMSRGKEMSDSVWIRQSDLNPNFYSPMLDDITEDYFPMTWQSIFEFALAKSDNNASDLLFGYTAPIDSVVEYWHNKGVEDFDIHWNESQIHQDPKRSDDNWTTPLAAARVMAATAPMAMISSNYTLAVAGAVMMHCATGENRIIKPLNSSNALVWHKTGTGVTDFNGNPTSVNDVAYILLPSGKVYTLAVFVKDSQVPMAETEEMIANISQMVLEYVFDESDIEAQTPKNFQTETPTTTDTPSTETPTETTTPAGARE